MKKFWLAAQVNMVVEIDEEDFFFREDIFKGIEEGDEKLEKIAIEKALESKEYDNWIDDKMEEAVYELQETYINRRMAITYAEMGNYEELKDD